MKCSECPNQAFLPVTDRVILDHFRGRHVAGVYPLLPDDTCWFLAVDFDKGAWQTDVAAFVETCRGHGVSPAVERSRSGDGAHVWFFFTAPIPARTARQMGSRLLTETMDRHHSLPMRSYDRLFPNQDLMPRGGLGNLIALPLQGGPRQQRHSAFGDDGQDAAPWERAPSRRPSTLVLSQPLPPRVGAVLAQALFVSKAGLPSPILNRIQRLATFHNPEFYQRQATRRSTARTPRLLCCAEDGGEHIALPRGCLDQLQELLSEHGTSLEVDDLVANYGHVVVDECHHVPAVSFERVLREVKARYLTGLTATPRRRDGLHPILHLQLGPIRFSVGPREPSTWGRVLHRLVVRETGFRLTDSASQPGLQQVYPLLAFDGGRNTLILNDVIRALEEGRSPLLLTERREHLAWFADQLRGVARNIVVLQGGMRSRERREALAQLATMPDAEERVVLATGRYAGEGFDDARLDTLFLALPVSWRGTLVQYAGRLHRRHPGKAELRVMDYADRQVPMLERMFQKRLRGYRAMGYVLGELAVSDTGADDYVLDYDVES